jgi:phage terminase small subunit
MSNDNVREINRPPAALAPHGRELWRSVMTRYTLNPSEQEILYQMCKTSDQLERIDTAIKGLRHLTTTGSQGQSIMHPLLQAHRSHVDTVKQLAVQLNLPDLVGAPPRNTKSRGRIEKTRAMTSKRDRETA